jgi:hypothetical protein
MAKKWKKRDNQGNIVKPTALGESDGANVAVDLLGEYMKELKEWGEKVRLDIIRLEGAAGFSFGDPGEVPEPPWNGDE